jgi:hypothetical protein
MRYVSLVAAARTSARKKHATASLDARPFAKAG